MTPLDARSAAVVATPARAPRDRVVLAGYYPPPLGGESVHVAELARRLRMRGVAVDIVNLRRDAAPSPDYHRVTGAVSLFRTLRRGLREGGLLHLHTNGHSAKSWSVILIAAVALAATRGMGVLTLHSGLCPGYLGRRRRLGRALIRRALAPFAEIVCVNAAIRDALLGLGAPASRLSIVPAYLGLDAPGTLTDPDAALIARFTPCLVVAGSSDPEYGLGVLVAAVERLRHRYPALGCVVMGDGDTRALRAVIGDHGLTDRMLCLGEVAHARYLAFLERADVFVRPTTVDGDAISVREALALGKPVVASATDFRPQGVVLFRAGDPVDLAEKLAATIERPQPSDARAEGSNFDDLLAMYARAHRARSAGPPRPARA